MIRIAITPAAFDAIAATLPLGSVGYEAKVGSNGSRPSPRIMRCPAEGPICSPPLVSPPRPIRT
jgi:hypothetical protein